MIQSLPPGSECIITSCHKMSGVYSFFWTKWSNGRRERTDCKQRGTKWNAEGAEGVSSQPTSRKPCLRWKCKFDFYFHRPWLENHYNQENRFFRIIENQIWRQGWNFGKSYFSGCDYYALPYITGSLKTFNPQLMFRYITSTISSYLYFNQLHN